MSNTNISITGKTITVAGAGFRHEVEVREGETVAAALDRSGVDASGLGVDLLIGGERRDASEVSFNDVEDRASVAAPPKSAALGA